MSLSKDSPPSLISLHLINATFTNCVFRNTNHPNLLGLESWLEFPFAKFEYDATFPLMMLRENFHFHFHNRPLSCITLMPGCGLLWHASRWSWLGQVTMLICYNSFHKNCEIPKITLPHKCILTKELQVHYRG